MDSACLFLINACVLFCVVDKYLWRRYLWSKINSASHSKPLRLIGNLDKEYRDEERENVSSVTPDRRILARRDLGCNPELGSGSPVDFRIPQLFHRRLRTDWRVVHLFESVRSRFRSQDWKNLDMPVVVVVDRLPIAQILGWMQTTRRGVKHQVKVFGH